MKLLLHTCCAPCLIYPLERLRQGGFEPAVYFYNPNIHPLEEYNLRFQAAHDLSAACGAPFARSDYFAQEFFRSVCGHEEPPGRCSLCWDLRLRRTAQFAAGNGFEYISTTLLVSPYQDLERIKKIGEQASAEAGVKFYYEDFRPGFRHAHNEAKSRGIYCQKYCGCIYSQIERSAKKNEKWSSIR